MFVFPKRSISASRSFMAQKDSGSSKFRRANDPAGVVKPRTEMLSFARTQSLAFGSGVRHARTARSRGPSSFSLGASSLRGRGVFSG